MNYFGEAIIVGLATMILGTFLSVASMYIQPDFKISKIDFWPALLGVNFLTGFILHLICEWTGVNRWYCKNGNACKKK
jgi:hypothetical protein